MKTLEVRRLVMSAVLAAGLAAPGIARATPSTVFWAPSTPYLQPYRKLHVTYDTYFSRNAAYPVDAGLTIGALPWQRFQMEVGFDLLYPTFSSGEPMGFPILLNAKVGAPEGAYFEGSPGWSAGIYSAGFEEDVTDYDVLHAMVGKTFPRVGSLSAGGYYGLNETLFRSSSGSDERAGFMAGWVSPAIDVPLIDKLLLAWDVQSGENVFGATGGGLYVYFNPDIDLILGPVYFFDPDLQPGGSRWMWSIQLDVDMGFQAPAQP
jgi:hypothetical protein